MKEGKPDVNWRQADGSASSSLSLRCKCDYVPVPLSCYHPECTSPLLAALQGAKDTVNRLLEDMAL